MEFLDLVKIRKSIRSFSDEKVDIALIKRIISVATNAPTNCNQQLWNFIVITDAELKERLIKEAASNTLFRKAPVLVAVTYDGWNYKEAIQGASIAVGHMLLAATEFGIGSLPMNSYGSDREIKKILEIPDSETICCFVVFGYPDDRARTAPPVLRRPVDEVVHLEKFSKRGTPPFTYNPNNWTMENIKDHQKYYCRKTFLGKEMDIMAVKEREIIRRELNHISGPVLDIFSYDGAYIREFPEVGLTTVDLINETREYTQKSVALYAPDKNNISHILYEDFLNTNKKFKTITILYKLERVPDKTKEEIIKRAFHLLEKGGQLVIISRKSNLFLHFFFFAIKVLFGKELRKTGIYNFFGPYRPLNIRKTVSLIRSTGFKNVKWEGYFILPAFYEQIMQMLIQYIKSGGSSYLHREKRDNILTKFLSLLINLQGFKRFGLFGSVAVIKCQK